MDITCPFCHQSLLNDPALAGQAVACPHCGRQFTMPGGQPEVPQPPPVPPQNAGHFAVDEEQRRPVSSRNKRRGSSARRAGGDDTLNLILGIVGSIVLFVGVFAPFIRVPFMGGVDYFRNGEGDGVIVLLLGGLSFIFVLCRLYHALWFTGIGSLAVIGFTFINFKMKMAEARREMGSGLAGNPFADLGDAMVQSVSIDWGFPVLIIGAGMVIAAAAIPKK